MKITKEQARYFLLAHQNLWPPRHLQGKDGVLEYIRHVGSIQFDPLDMVGYNPNLVLQSRVQNYRPEMLHELLYEERRLIDGWDKNMSIYAVEDWPYFSRYREKEHMRHGSETSPIYPILPEIRDVIREKGSISSGDLNFDLKVDWPWAPTRASRAALESMYFWGELIIQRKAGTRKYYDFADKYVPQELLAAPDPNTTPEEFYQWNVKRRIGAIGLLWNRLGDAWLGIGWMKTKERNEAFAVLEASGEIVRIEVDEIKYPFYILIEDLPRLQKVIEEKPPTLEIAILAPLDNLIWDRKLIKELFDFEYIWEVYKPEGERKYGYYVLPILYGDTFVGRFESKLNKKTKKLEMINWWWEEGVTVDAEMEEALARAFSQFLYYLDATSLQFVKGCKNTKSLSCIKKVKPSAESSQ